MNQAEIEELFKKKETKAFDNTKTTAENVALSVAPVAARKIFDPKKSQAIEMALIRLKNVDVKAAIINYDESKLSLE